ncbi:MAG: hypothetical protein ABIN97_15480 [Ginsengibacter sp.]
MVNNTNDLKETKSKFSPSGIITLGKDLVALLRDTFLFILVMMLLFLPEKLNKTLVRAGFKEGSIAGFKWEAGIAQYDVNLKESQAAINDLKAQLDSTSRVLAEAQSKITDPALKQKLEKVEEENKVVKASSAKIQASARTTISNNMALVEKAQVAISTDDKWGVVFSGDTNLKLAQYEIGLAKRKYNIPDAVIYFRQGSYRSVAIADSREEARELLISAKRRRSDAYIVPLSSWCQTANDKGDYIECTTP